MVLPLQGAILHFGLLFLLYFMIASSFFLHSRKHEKQALNTVDASKRQVSMEQHATAIRGPTPQWFPFGAEPSATNPKPAADTPPRRQTSF